MAKLLFIGQAPSRESDGNPPFTGRCGKFQAEELLGTTQEQMLLDFEFVNVLERWPGKSFNGDLFPISIAKEAAKKLLEKMVGRTVILLGHGVARAFGVEKFAYFQWYELRAPADPRIVICRRIAIIPHPSQKSRIWNIAKNREIARKFLLSAKAL